MVHEELRRGPPRVVAAVSQALSQTLPLVAVPEALGLTLPKKMPAPSRRGLFLKLQRRGKEG